jgi:hypothetical protein
MQPGQAVQDVAHIRHGIDEREDARGDAGEGKRGHASAAPCQRKPSRAEL